MPEAEYIPWLTNQASPPYEFPALSYLRNLVSAVGEIMPTRPVPGPDEHVDSMFFFFLGGHFVTFGSCLIGWPKFVPSLSCTCPSFVYHYHHASNFNIRCLRSNRVYIAMAKGKM